VGKQISDDELMLALITSHSQTEAAEMLGVTKTTVSRRVNKPEFREMFAKYRKQKLDTVNTRLVNASEKAVDVLTDLLDSNNEISRYNASSRILSLSQDFISMQDIVERLDKLEQMGKDSATDDEQ
jgi:predicted transcriptional regulator